MLDFKPLTPFDFPMLQPYLNRTPELCCDCSPACMVMWGSADIARCGDFYVPIATYDGQISYLRPLGGLDFSPILPEIMEDARARGIPFRIRGLTPAVRAALEASSDLVFTTNRDSYDYLYETAALATLSGRKLQSKRNHIHRFESEYPDCQCVPITEDLLPACQKMCSEWYREHFALGENPALFAEEQRVLSIAFARYGEFGFDGLCMMLDGHVVAFSFGMRLSTDTFDVCFEKAFSSMEGSYAAINRAFSRMVAEKYPEIQYLNREDDMGLAGLRKAKLSYHPFRILETYTAMLPETQP